ncbi:MAG: HPr family phosphocarrier protein [Lachnospiraceae bacterium]|nr:HPr family phosphocarrier protein [Lachnospiraceae bacterium]
MITKKITIGLNKGLEASPTALLVQTACQYSSKIYIEIDDNKKVNAKSIMGMMTLGLNAGEEVIVSADGEDEETAIVEIEKFLTKQ